MLAVSTEHRELTLMFTDIVGYSRLMGRDEALTIDMLGQYREILQSHIEKQGGVLVEFAGDAIFARFDSSITAVNAAIAIQQHLHAFNEVRDKKLPPLQTRIGLHKGEVMLRDSAVFGDSVNIAARLEPLAVPDGICISQTVYDEIRFTLSSPAKRLGMQKLKNIEHKIRAYLIKPTGIGWRDHLHYFLRGFTEKLNAYRYPLAVTTIALIAAAVYFIPRWLVPGYAANYVEIADFQNLMNEKGDADYFSAGITEAVRSQLADMRDVYIVDAKEGIHAPIRLEGSVQKLGDNLRIAYRLFRRKDNVQIAGGKLDGTYQDIFILQDRLVGEIARYLADEFDLQNFRPAPLRLTGDVTAYDYYMRGLDYLNSAPTHQNIDEAVKSFSTAIVHDDNFISAYYGLCNTYRKKYELTLLSEWLDNAEKNCKIALDKDPMSSKVYMAFGRLYREAGQYNKALEFLDKGSQLGGEDAGLYLSVASVYDLMGRKEQAENLYNKAIKLEPKNWKVYDGYGFFLAKNGRHDDAIDNYKKVLFLVPDNSFALNNIGINYLYKNDYKVAASYFEQASLVEPNSSIFANIGTMYYLLSDFERALDFYLKASRLEPQNYQWLAYMGDSYKYIPTKKKVADDLFYRVIKMAQLDVEKNNQSPRAYFYLARAYAYFGDFEQANNNLNIANELDGTSVESLYSNLRVAIASNDVVKIKKYAKKLLESEYSKELLLSDSDFSVLKGENFQDLFVDR